MANKQQTWGPGDVFLVPTRDGMAVAGQVLAEEPKALNSVSCAFFDTRVPCESDLDGLPELSTDGVFSILLVTRDLLDKGVWRVVRRLPVSIPRSKFPYEHLRSSGFVGAKIVGSANVGEFMDAFYGLTPWDNWKDPEYLDKLLVSPDKKPKRLLLRKSEAAHARSGKAI